MLLVMRQLRVPNLKVAAILLPGCLAYVSDGRVGDASSSFDPGM